MSAPMRLSHYGFRARSTASPSIITQALIGGRLRAVSGCHQLQTVCLLFNATAIVVFEYSQTRCEAGTQSLRSGR